MDWQLCLVCQEESTETLKCPLNTLKSGDKSMPYSTFLTNFNAFIALGALPVPVKFGNDITVDELVKHQAVWHKSCYVKFSKEKLDRATKKRDRDDATESGSSTFGGKRPRRQSLDKMACMFCKDTDGHLHEFRTLEMDETIRQMAIDLHDSDILANLSGGDLVAIEAKYHLDCLTAFRNRHRSMLRKQKQDTSSDHPSQGSEEKKVEARALVELIAHIENCVEEGIFYFKFSVLHQMYESRLQDLGVEKETNRSRLKEKILAYFTQAQEQSDGKNKILVFEQGMQQLLKQAMNTCDYEGDALILSKAAKIVRRDILDHEGFTFSGIFPAICQQGSVPAALKTLVSMLLNGSDLTDQELGDSQPILTISQTILFNLKKHTSSATKARHSLDREPPLPLYIGLKVHTETRSKNLLSQLFNMGLSVSYERVLQLEGQLATAVCNNFQSKGVVVPAELRHGLFTAGALDNLDHNPSSTSAKGSFHGTGISLFQFPTDSNFGLKQGDIRLPTPDVNNSYKLPDQFTTVPAVALKTANVSVPAQLMNASISPDGVFIEERLKEEGWFEHAGKLLDREIDVKKGDTVAWSAYHASKQNADIHTTLTKLLPLFYEKAATAAMIKHGMNVVRWATNFLNPGQIPLIALDAPLYALAKFVQWNWPNTHGERTFVIMFGGLHIEMAMWKTFGDYLDGSGWTDVLTQAGIASSGTADSFLKALHVTRTRHAHQVTALALAQLQHDAFVNTEGSHDGDAREVWREDMIKKSPTFQYWDTILNMEITGLLFIRSHREANFTLYVESLKALVPWFFALDHYNYARWIPVHIRDMETLPQSILEEFENHGHWVVHKTQSRFSSIPIDQAHEQNNQVVKGAGGAIGLTENPTAFRKWMVSGPEQARLMVEFEASLPKEGKDDSFHHEEGLATQRHFKEHVANLISVINELGNPFLHDNEELVALDTKNVLDQSVVNTVRTIHKTGKDQYAKYCKEVITYRSHSIHDPIRKNSFPLFSCPQPKSKAKHLGKVSMLKNDVALFSRLYIVMQHRESDMTEFFRHENQPFPPSLSDGGKLRLGKKSDLLSILVQEAHVDLPEIFDVKLLDGAAIVHLLPTANSVTFDEYAELVFIPYIMNQLHSCKRVDIVWDTYLPQSIKDSTRVKRGKGVRRKVAGKNKLPRNWADFLRDSSNKQELFGFLTDKIAGVVCPENKEIAITSGPTVTVLGTDQSMGACDHEEADTRLVVHLQDAVQRGLTKCLLRTVDTDVVVILIGKFHHLVSLSQDVDIWIAFGTGKGFMHIHINAICAGLGRDKSLALPVFHSFTGCDTTSAFFGRGKKSAWEAWVCYPEVTNAFTYIASNPFSNVEIGSECFQLLEHFTVVLYDKTSDLEHVDEARLELYCQKGKNMETIPPTQGALLQHTKRVVYQAGIWCSSDLPEQHAPIPEGWGWTLNDDTQSWVPIWTVLPVASQACSELVKCGCKSQTGCSSARCACNKAKWKCTALCSCCCEK